MQLKGSKIVVVGGAGLIGSHTIDHLLKEDVKEIVVYDNFVRGRTENLNAALRDPRVRVFDVGGDIMQTDILEAAFDGADGVCFTWQRCGFYSVTNSRAVPSTPMCAAPSM